MQKGLGHGKPSRACVTESRAELSVCTATLYCLVGLVLSEHGDPRV